jgi:hypothetical protein
MARCRCAEPAGVTDAYLPFRVIPSGTTAAQFQAIVDNAVVGTRFLFSATEFSWNSGVTIDKVVSLEGQGEWATQIKPTGDFAGPILNFAVLPPDPDAGTPALRNHYGTMVSGIGIDLTNAPSATGVRFGATTDRATLRDSVIRGGSTSVHNLGAHNRIETSAFYNPTASFIAIDGDAGLELTVDDVALHRDEAGATNAAIDVWFDSGGSKGALTLSNVRLLVDRDEGATATTGINVVAPAAATMALLAHQTRLEDVTGTRIALTNVEIVHETHEQREMTTWFPGVFGNYVSAPDAPSLDITGDITLIMDIALDDWSPVADQSVVSKDEPNTQRSWGFAIQAVTGRPYLFWTTDGTNATASFTWDGLFTGFSGVPNGERRKIAMTVDANNGVGSSYTRVWQTEDNGATWRPLGGPGVAPIINIFVSTASLAIGNGFAGKIHSVSVRNGIGPDGFPGGTEVAYFDADLARGQRYRDRYGNVFTHNGSAWALMEA